ncbi:hypothetical protein HK101_007436, partial [Irineochytrium annulatum]
MHCIALWWLHPGSAKYHTSVVEELALECIKDLPAAMQALGSGEERLGLEDLKQRLGKYESSATYQRYLSRFRDLGRALGDEQVKWNAEEVEEAMGAERRKDVVKGQNYGRNLAVMVADADNKPEVNPALYLHFDPPRPLTNALSTVSKAVTAHPNFDQLTLTERRSILREFDKKEGRRIQFANLVKLKREGRFVVEDGESEDTQLARCRKSQFQDTWNIRKSSDQIF